MRPIKALAGEMMCLCEIGSLDLFFNHTTLVFKSAARFTTQYIRGEAAALTFHLLVNGRGNAER